MLLPPPLPSKMEGPNEWIDPLPEPDQPDSHPFSQPHTNCSLVVLVITSSFHREDPPGKREARSLRVVCKGVSGMFFGREHGDTSMFPSRSVPRFIVLACELALWLRTENIGINNHVSKREAQLIHHRVCQALVGCEFSRYVA